MSNSCKPLFAECQLIILHILDPVTSSLPYVCLITYGLIFQFYGVFLFLISCVDLWPVVKNCTL